MGILDNLKRIARPYDDETFEDYEEKPKAAPAASSWIEGEDLNVPEKKTGNKVVNIHATARLQVVLVMPEQYEAAREIAVIRENRSKKASNHAGSLLSAPWSPLASAPWVSASASSMT